LSSPDDTSGDRRLLASLFADLQELLEWIVQYRSRLLPPDIADRLEPAWEELQLSFADVRRALLEPQSSTSADETNAGKQNTGDQITDDQLRRYGLTGAQLKLKVETFKDAKAAFDLRYKSHIERGGFFTRLFSHIRRLFRRKEMIGSST